MTAGGDLPPRGEPPDSGADEQPLLYHDRTSADALPGLDDPPPFLGSWSRVYVFVIVSQAIVVILLAIFGAVHG